MATHDHVPEPGRHGRASAEELLYDTERTRVLRLRLPDSGPVIVKELRGPRAAARLRHEQGILQRLAGVDGAPRLAEGVSHPGTIVVEDIGGRSVADVAAQARFGVTELVTFGVALARVVADLHRRGVIHRDVNPANIVVSDESPGQVQLIDFDLATTFAEERPAFTHQSQVTGTLPYLAPEQTGRTGRAVDQRADLYAVGATLYMLATGTPPFGDSDREPLDLIHDHLTQAPVPPADVNPALPAALSAIILRLLEKEPDRRYQSADGLAYDLSRLKPDAAGRYRTFPLGESDFPMRLTPPSTLVGRDTEIGILRDTFAAVAAGGRRTVLVTGAPGVGKTALIDELRPLVTAAGGWFVSGKFDQYRRDADSNGLRQSLRGLGRMLLAEPDEHLTGDRARILDALGANAGLIAALLPEFALLLDVAPDEHDPRNTFDADTRVVRAEVDLLRSIASPTRPVVIVLDDLQWAESTAIGLLDEVVMDDDVSGVLVVGAYRDSEVDATHPLSGRLARWQRSAQPPVPLRLHNLPPADLGSLVSAMLRMPRDSAASLIDAVVSRTDGNPYDTVELINWLRREGALERADGRWRWDTGLIRGYLGRGDVTELLRERMDRLPAPTRTLLLIMACLGGAVTLDLLIAATGAKADSVERDVTPALEDGLLVVDRDGEPAVRFRHDRVQQAAHDALDPDDREEIHLLLARTLAAHPGLAAVAAEQYLSALSAVHDSDERLRAASLFRVTAADVGLVNPAAAERFLAAAVDLVDGVDHREDALRIGLRIDRHAALYRLGRLNEADEEYAAIERLCPLPLDRVDAACLQISSLSNRNRSAEALDLGLTLLRALGCAAPEGEAVGPGIGSGLDALYRWVEQDGLADDSDRPEVTDPVQIAIAKLINRSLPAAFFAGQPVMGWLALEAWRQWIEHGPGAPLVGPISHMSFVTIIVRQDYRIGYRVMRWILAAAEARGYEPQASQSRFLFALGSGHWFDSLPDTIAQARHAHEILQRHGDLQNACCTYYTSTVQLLACAPTIDSFRADAEAGIAFGVRSGNDQATAAYIGYRQLGRALCGETNEVGGFDDADHSEAAHRVELATNPTAAANYHAARALTALVFGDWAAHATNAAAAVALLPFIPSTFAELHARLVQSIALAMRAPGDGPEALAELQTHRDWLAGRAEDAPHNYRHLLLWVDAERAAATGDSWGAVRTFDAALSEARRTQQPLFTALIHERAAVLHLGLGLEYTGRRLLAEARHGYAAWGAVAKVRELDRQHGFLRAAAPSRTGGTASRTSTMTLAGEAIDLLGVLRASQALSSETNLDRLHAQVAATLRAMTGAETVKLLFCNDETGEWVLTGTATDGAGARIPVAEAGQRGLLPVSPFRYVERTRQSLLVDDAGSDNRFAHDPYVAGLDTCSLMVVPILARGLLRAMLILENRSSRGTFSQERLDAVMLIAGQLAVSLDNALLYASLEQKVVERTEALEAANRQLERLSATDALTGLANRRQLEVILAAEWQNASRRQVPLAVAMVDVDHFKSYNDRYGHGAGDRCLRSVASVLNHHVRGEDTVARYGGEEFTIVLPSADANAAYMVAERVRAAVAALDEPHAGSEFGVVSVSVGVAAAVPTVDTTPEALIEQADAQLYEAKRGGRNRVAGYSPDSGPVPVSDPG
jgi:diguanylate cyclase (GGDEF)-like protein